MANRLYLMKTIFGYFFFTLTIVLFSSYVFAQPGDPDGGSDPDNPVPIDGVSLLVAAGGIYGARKIYSRRKKKQSEV